MARVTTTIEVVFSVVGLLFSVVLLSLALTSIQAMSGHEPFRQSLTFFGPTLAVAFGLGAACILPLGGRYRMVSSFVVFAVAGAVGGTMLAGALRLMTVFERDLRALTNGGPTGIFLLAATIAAVAVPVLLGIPMLHLASRRRPDCP